MKMKYHPNTGFTQSFGQNISIPLPGAGYELKNHFKHGEKRKAALEDLIKNLKSDHRDMVRHLNVLL
jgi:hypothetical protein